MQRKIIPRKARLTCTQAAQSLRLRGTVYWRARAGKLKAKQQEQVMVAGVQLRTTLRNAIGDQLVSDIGNAGYLRLYDGVKPGNCATALSGNNLLLQLTMGSPFAGSTTLGEVNPTLPSSTTVSNSGTQTFFRLYKADGTTCVYQDDASSLLLTPALGALTAGDSVALTSLKIIVGGAGTVDVVVVNPDDNYINGYIDLATTTGVFGWAGADGAHQLRLIVNVNGTDVATIFANQSRPDVYSQLPSVGQNAGFGYGFSPVLDSTQNQTIGVRVYGTNVQLNHSPQTIEAPGQNTGGGYNTDPSSTGIVIQGIAASVATSDEDLRTHPSVIRYADLTNQTTINNDFQHAAVFYGTSATVDQPLSFITDARTGIRLIRVPMIPGLNSDTNVPGSTGATGASWRGYTFVDSQATQEMWLRYYFMIDPDMNTGFNETGMKLPGMSGSYEFDAVWSSGAWGNPINAATGQWWMWRNEFDHPPATGIYPAQTYLYDYQSQVVEGLNGASGARYNMTNGAAYRAGQLYCLEQHIKLNSISGVAFGATTGTPNADGLLEFSIDGVLCLRLANRVIRSDTRANFDQFFFNPFHGGHEGVLSRVDMYFGGMVSAKAYIGPAKSLGVTFPSSTFYSALTRYAWATFPNSQLAVQGPAQLRGDYVEASFSLASSTTNGWTYTGINDWSGMAWDSGRGRAYMRFGGHNSTHWNGMLSWDAELAAAGDAHGGWRIPMQPNLYSNTDINSWSARLNAAGIENQYENGWLLPATNDGLWKADTLQPALPTSLHSYNCLEWSETLGGMLQQHPSYGAASAWFFLFKPDGTYSTLSPANAYRSRSGIMLVDTVNDYMLGFNLWPGGPLNGVRRFNLKTKSDLAAISLNIMSIASGYTVALSSTVTSWSDIGFGFLAGRVFHYRQYESGVAFNVNIDTWVAREEVWSGLSVVPMAGQGAYSPVTQCAYWIGTGGALWQMYVPTLTCSVVTTTGTGPNGALSTNGTYGRLRYHGPRGCLVHVNSASENVFCIKVDP